MNPIDVRAHSEVYQLRLLSSPAMLPSIIPYAHQAVWLITVSSRLDRLTLLDILQLSTKNTIPKPRSDTKPILEVGKVMLQMVFLQTLPVGRQCLVM